MIKLIVGSKGSGKTKKLIDEVNKASSNSKGHVVCIEKGDSLRFDIKYNVRLIDINEYKVSGIDAYYGFFAGLLAGNYDITDILGDATFKILSGSSKGVKDQSALEELVKKLEALTKNSNCVITLTVSCEESDIPESIRQYIC